MDRNVIIISEGNVRELPAEFRKGLHRALGRKSAIVDHEVLDGAQALCERGAYGLAFDFYQILDGQPLIPYQGCGFGLMMNLKELMDERDLDPTGTILA
jgi:hypothetical protein